MIREDVRDARTAGYLFLVSRPALLASSEASPAPVLGTPCVFKTSSTGFIRGFTSPGPGDPMYLQNQLYWLHQRLHQPWSWGPHVSSKPALLASSEASPALVLGTPCIFKTSSTGFIRGFTSPGPGDPMYLQNQLFWLHQRLHQPWSWGPHVSSKPALLASSEASPALVLGTPCIFKTSSTGFIKGFTSPGPGDPMYLQNQLYWLRQYKTVSLLHYSQVQYETDIGAEECDDWCKVKAVIMFTV
ncbi:hypothetical protein AOXY_G1502 [Acipenser oxyrinchus oxyrinchus]|uniref:Uncharacterized protein n=1 Tax=Acipenser oxyrinchus oxyrinchus TaxID=40147 RepID=A0AAD8LWD4_ACIOX|nr:hypothetical protein AOXY_G1502 [Acipenser oxyrinchus oxyrinchus]